MNILFVVGGNSENFDIPPLLKAQGDSLEKQGMSVSYFLIVGKGLAGYLKNIFKLRRYLKQHKVDIIHAHFSYSGVISSLAAKKTPIVVSLLGSDVLSKRLVNKIILKLIPFYSWRLIIVKSAGMKKKLRGQDAVIIPNGVNVDLFKPMDKLYCKQRLRLSMKKKYVLFLADPKRHEKNYRLTRDAVNLLNNDDICLIHIDNVKHEDMPIWLNAADVVALSSLWEGSPNVIKESMACNRPIVSTNVGDISWLFSDVPGNFIAEFQPQDFAKKINLAMLFSKNYGETAARNRIIELGLDSGAVAEKIIGIYRGAC